MHNNLKLAMYIINTVVTLVLAMTMTAVAADYAANITTSVSASGIYSFLLPLRHDYIHTPCVGSHKFHTRAQTWNVARKICEEEGGYLAIINSVAEADVLKSIFEKVRRGAVTNSPESDRYAAIGFHDLYQENEFVTIHGDSLYKAGFTKWAPGQPDNTNGIENCGSFHISGRLNDINCHTRFPFFCELR